jgi:predicted aspartyl protease
MNIRYTIGPIIFLSGIITSSISAAAFDLTFESYRLNKEGGIIEVQALRTDDNPTRAAVRQQLQEEARKGISPSTPAMRKHGKQIRYRYEKTRRGGRIRIKAANPDALAAVQDFLRSRMSQPSTSGTIVFDFVPNSPLIVVPVMINNSGPYKFLLDTGATKTVMSTTVADGLAIPKGRTQILFSAASNLPVTTRKINVLQLGKIRELNVEVVVGKLPLLKTLQVDGLLGGDYLRRFKVSIDYDNMIVDIQPCLGCG